MEFKSLMMDGATHTLTFNDIKQAAERIKGSIIHTPLCEAKFTRNMDYDVYLKCENLQYTGSSIERGVRNALMAYGDQAVSRGIIVPSRGNTALAAAYHGSNLGIPVTVVLPEKTSPSVAQRCSEFGAEVVICGENFDETIGYTQKAQKESGQIILTSDDPLVMAGLGTVGLEIVTQLPEVDAVLVPAGSGALLAGIIVACKKLKCSCLVYGGECSKAPVMWKALQAGNPVSVVTAPNLVSSYNISTVSPNAFQSLKGRLDRMLLIDESHIARAMITMLEREHLVADGSGVCAIAAVMQGLVPELRGKRAVCVLSGGNVDSNRLCRVIQRGLGACGRLLRFAVTVPDHRAGLEMLAKSISEKNAVLKSLVTEQMWVHTDVSSTWANVVVETANEDHAASLKDHLRDLYPTARFALTDVDDKHKILVR